MEWKPKDQIEKEFAEKKQKAQETARLKAKARAKASEEINLMASALVVSTEEEEEAWKKIKTMFPHYNDEYKTNPFYINLKNMFINSPYFDKDGNKLKSLDFTRI